MVYQRFPRVELHKDYQPFSADKWRTTGPTELVRTTIHYVGFCGKSYKVLKLYAVNKDDCDKSVCAYKIEDVDRYVEEYFPKYLDHYQNGVPRNRFGDSLSKWNYNHTRKSLEEILHPERFSRPSWMKKNDDPFKITREFQEKERCPIHVLYGDKTVVNDCLKNFDFAKVFDPYQAFQEIAMWLGNQAEPRKDIPTISDEIMVEIKGFDEWSFRKPPSGKKRRKKK